MRRVYLRGGPKAGKFYTVGNVNGDRLIYESGVGAHKTLERYVQTGETVAQDGQDYEIFVFDTN